MPTNKLWLEHTERAAWDSVEALRERLLKAEERLQALVPGVDRVPQLLDALQQAKQRHAPGAASHDEVVGALLTELERLQGELEAAKTPSPTVVSFGAELPRQRLDSEDFDATASKDDEQADLTRFTQSMRRRLDGFDAKAPKDLNRLLSQAEAKLDDLTELEGGALRDAAVDLALLAGLIYEASRGRG